VNFLGYLDWLGPNHKYFLKTEGLIKRIQYCFGLRVDLQHSQGLQCKMVENIIFLDLFSNGKFGGQGPQHVDLAARFRSTACGPGGAAQVHSGSRQRGKQGTVASCWHAAHGR
jgi:hypothetical protein